MHKDKFGLRHYRTAAVSSSVPASQAPLDGNDPGAPNAPEPSAPPPPRPVAPFSFYETHELLQMINDLEDERRWARLREGMLWAFFAHVLLIVIVILLPRYIFVPRVVEPKLSTNDKNQWTYLDSPRVAPKPKLDKPLVQPTPPAIDQNTLEQMRKQAPQPAAKPEPQQQADQSKPQIPNPIPPAPQSQAQVEAPRPSAVPAKPSFALGAQNPADQLRDAMRGSMRGSQGSGQIPPSAMQRHPGAAAGGAQILSDTQGVNFDSWLRRWYIETERAWDPLIPDEVNPPILKQGAVQIRFKIQPNGRLMEGSMVLEGRSGDVALDRAAWGALTGSNYPPLPADFHGPYLELRAIFLYNIKQP